MNLKLVEDIANAVLYEGYLLYPYRASAVKNRTRWNFGVVYPPGYVRSQAGTDNSRMRAEVLARGDGLRVCVRFLQISTRETLDANGCVSDSWQEAVERDVCLELSSIKTLTDESIRSLISFPAEVETETTGIVRRREGLKGWVEISGERIDDGWLRIQVTVDNIGAFAGADRERALLSSFISTHAVLTLEEGEFASLLEPPAGLEEAAKSCEQIGTFPVLAGERGTRDAVLCSPVILYDYPEIAPESAGQLFDGTEIDEILSLRILAMTDGEKAEMREVDEFARRILERTESLTAEQFMSMHGVMRRPTDPGAKF